MGCKTKNTKDAKISKAKKTFEKVASMYTTARSFLRKWEMLILKENF